MIAVALVLGGARVVVLVGRRVTRDRDKLVEQKGCGFADFRWTHLRLLRRPGVVTEGSWRRENPLELGLGCGRRENGRGK